MSEQTVPTIDPTDSASNISSKRRSRLGKKQRQAAKSVDQASAITGASQAPAQAAFAMQRPFAPTPQPGKYPVVFPSGAGEATREVKFTYDGDSIAEWIADLGENFCNSARFAEFSSFSGYAVDSFKKDVAKITLLSLAQQTVHAHQNVVGGVGDFSAISSSDVFIMSSIRAIVQQFGEFTVEPLGNRYLLADFSSAVHSLVQAAKAVDEGEIDDVRDIVRAIWLPACRNDPRTNFILAKKMQPVLSRNGVFVPLEELQSALFVREPPAFTAAAPNLPQQVRAFRHLFTAYNSRADFVGKFTGNGNVLLQTLGLHWFQPEADDMNWTMVPKVVFPELLDSWIKKRTTLTKFFLCGSGPANKSAAIGSASQLSRVTHHPGVTLVETRVDVTAGEKSLLVCFPPSGLFAEMDSYNVFQSTGIPVKNRATIFTQDDWIA